MNHDAFRVDNHYDTCRGNLRLNRCPEQPFDVPHLEPRVADVVMSASGDLEGTLCHPHALVGMVGDGESEDSAGADEEVIDVVLARGHGHRVEN